MNRAIVIVVGRERFALEQIHIDEAPYLTADIALLPDVAEASAVMLAVLADDVDLEQRQRLLSERSASARLEQINAVLRTALPDLELRAAMHAR